MSLKPILAFIKSHSKIITFVLGGLASLVGSAAYHMEDEIKAAVKDRRAVVEISTSTPKVGLHKTINLEGRVDSIGLSDLSTGTVSLEGDLEYLSIKPNRSVRLDAMSGSKPIENLPEIKAIKVAPNPVRITATYVSGDLKVASNSLYIEIVEPVKVPHPHFDRSDTSRVNLSGQWNIDVGGDPGTMTIVQGTDNSILTGTYEIPGSRWPRGTISGYKDGATFRVHFSIPGKEKTERLWVVGHFTILTSNEDYIEVKGCAYHLRRSTSTYNKVGVDDLDCDRPAYFNRWKVIQPANFYATAPFDKQEQD